MRVLSDQGSPRLLNTSRDFGGSNEGQAGAAKVKVPDEMVFLKKLLAGTRWAIVVLVVALAIALIISGYQYQASHPAPPGWELLD